jgi:hypothetical protein
MKRKREISDKRRREQFGSRQLYSEGEHGTLKTTAKERDDMQGRINRQS